MTQVRIVHFTCVACGRNLKAPVEWAGTKALCRTCEAENIVPKPETSDAEAGRKSNREMGRPSDDGIRGRAVRDLVEDMPLRDLACRSCGAASPYADNVCRSCGRELEYSAALRNQALREEGLVVLEELGDYVGRKVSIYVALRKFAIVYAVADMLDQPAGRELIQNFAAKVDLRTVLDQAADLAVYQKRDPEKRSALADLPRNWLIVKGPGPDYEKLQERVEELLVPG